MFKYVIEFMLSIILSLWNTIFATVKAFGIIIIVKDAQWQSENQIASHE